MGTNQQSLLAGMAPFGFPDAFVPVSWADVARYIDSFNTFARLWNVHQADTSLHPRPSWGDGMLVYDERFPSRLILLVDASKVEIWMSDACRVFSDQAGRTTNFRTAFYPDRLLNEARIDQVIRAGRFPNPVPGKRKTH